MGNKQSKWKKCLGSSKAKYMIAPIALGISLAYLLFFLPSGQSFVKNLISVFNFSSQFGIFFCIIAIGTALVLSTGGVDLSSMGMATLSGVMFAMLTKGISNPGIGTLLISILVVIVIGSIVGFINGFCISKLSSPPLIFTWAFSIILFTLSRIISGLGNMDNSKNGIPLNWSVHLTSLHYGIIILVIVGGVSLLHILGFVRKSCAIGANRNSALYIGLKVENQIMSTYILAGILSACAGIYSVYHTGSTNTVIYENQELIPIAIAVLAGTSMAGGSVNLYSVISAAFFWATVKNIVNNIDFFNSWSGNESEALNFVFSIIFILIVTIGGKKISGITFPIQVLKKTNNNA